MERSIALIYYCNTHCCWHRTKADFVALQSPAVALAKERPVSGATSLMRRTLLLRAGQIASQPRTPKKSSN
jgi:hypothetical protein